MRRRDFIDLTGEPEPAPTPKPPEQSARKGKRTMGRSSSSRSARAGARGKRARVQSEDEAIGPAQSSSVVSQCTGTGRQKTQEKKAKKRSAAPEKRLARLRKSASKATRDRISRAVRQRLFLVDSKAVNDINREFVVMGSTGNLYDISIGRLPSCSCIDFQKGNICKHILFVMLKVLRVNPSSNLVFQRGLLSSELRGIFSAAPATVIGSVRANDQVRTQYQQLASGSASAQPSGGVAQKPIEGDCPICMEDLEAKGGRDVTFCRAQCGQNIHQDCIDRYCTSRRRSGNAPTCPYCRAPWGAPGSSSKSESLNSRDGYINLGSAQGLSGRRPTSGYYRGPYQRYGRSSYY